MLIIKLAQPDDMRILKLYRIELIRNHKKIFLFISAIIIGSLTLFWITTSGSNVMLSPYPYGKNFAFTITDDPDDNKIDEIKIVYDFLMLIGLKTTVAVWINEEIRSDGLPEVAGNFDYGDTCENETYLKYIKNLKNNGFEIALHTVSPGNDYRQETIEGYEKFKKIFGEYPKINIMHADNLENIYWGKKVVGNSFIRGLVGFFYKKSNLPFQGENPKSVYFWGDVLKEKTKYVRLWGTSNINTLCFNPTMPYHDSQKPYVNYWFSYSDGYNAKGFNKLITDKNIQKLIKDRGTSIVYTHFGLNFIKKDKNGNMQLDRFFAKQIKKIAMHKDGWFVPASDILDRLLLMKNVYLIQEKNRLILINNNAFKVDGITLLINKNSALEQINGSVYKSNDEGEIVIEKMGPYETLVFFLNGKKSLNKNSYPSLFEKINMVIRRSFLVISQRD